MKLLIVSVRDRAAGLFSAPSFVGSAGIAVRSFADEVNRPDAGNVLYRHPNDFELFELGHYEDSTAEFLLHKHPKSLAIASNLVIPKDGAAAPPVVRSVSNGEVPSHV